MPTGPLEAVVSARGTGEYVYTLPYTNAGCERILNETGEGSATVDGEGFAECCGDIAEFEPWAHELSFIHQGSTIWTGPIVNMEWGDGSVGFYARDLSQWLAVRFIHNNMSWENEDLARIFAEIVDDALEPDRTMNLQVVSSECGKKGTRKVLAKAHRIAMEELEEIATTGVDWAVVGRQLRINLADTLIDSLDNILHAHDVNLAESPGFILDGQGQANRWIVAGEGGGEEGDVIWGDKSDAAAKAKYGLIERRADEEAIKDTNSANVAAQTRLDMWKVPAHTFDNLRLDEDCQIPDSSLVPGTMLYLAFVASCVDSPKKLRLKSVQWSGSAEEVTRSITLLPEGTEV